MCVSYCCQSYQSINNVKYLTTSSHGRVTAYLYGTFYANRTHLFDTHYIPCLTKLEIKVISLENANNTGGQVIEFTILKDMKSQHCS